MKNQIMLIPNEIQIRSVLLQDRTMLL